MDSKETIVQISQKHTCSITLRDLETKTQKFEFVNDKNIISAETYRDLVLYSPSSQSNLGTKISEKLKKHIDELVNEITKDLDIKNTYFFTSYQPKTSKKDLSEIIKKDNQPFLCLYCSEGFLQSFYTSIRNALAHGNISKKGKFFYLYSVCSKDGNKLDEKDKNLSFLLKIYNLQNISSYMDAFKTFN